MNFFRMHVLPAQRGDCLWIEYGDAAATHRILVDGGITKTGRDTLVAMMAALPAGARIDLLVVTHIDLDHIQGVIALLDRLPAGLPIDRVWFNGLRQLPREAGVPLEPFGVAEGIKLSEQLSTHHAAAWNVDTAGGAVGVEAGPGALPVLPLPGGMTATVLAPQREQLRALREKWGDVVEPFGAAADDEAAADEAAARDAGAIDGLEPMGAGIDVAVLARAKFDEDDAVANGSSIALLLEFAGRRALLLGDAYPSTIVDGLRRLSAAPLACDVVKLAHHGSRRNTSRELAAQLRAPRWVFSSNGASTRHPNPEAVARVLHDSPGTKQLVFNYRTGFNEMWDDEALKDEHGFSAVYGDGESAVVIDLFEPLPG